MPKFAVDYSDMTDTIRAGRLDKAGRCFLEKEDVTPHAVNAVMRYVVDGEPRDLAAPASRAVSLDGQWYRITVETLPGEPARAAE